MTPVPATDSSTPSNAQAFDAPPDMIGSLGDALTGMTLNGGSNLLGQSSPYEKRGSGGGGVDWSSNANAPSVSQPNGTFHNGQRVPSSNNLLFGTDLKDLAGPEPSTPVRKKSLDLFLSQSPSQSLGHEVINLQQFTNGPSGTGKNGSGNQSRAPGAIGAPSNGSNHRKAESPLGSVTGTSGSSRSQSPSLFQGGESIEHRRSTVTIPQFQGHDQTARSFSSGSGVHRGDLGQQHFQLSNDSGYGNLETISGLPRNDASLQYNQGGMESPFQQPAAPIPQVQAPTSLQPQVLYMAVPTPDGRGQMLQPVQMVHIQGQQQPAFVLPQQGSIQVGEQAPMMVLPSPQMTQQSSGIISSDNGSKSSSWQSHSSQYNRSDLSSQYGVDTQVGRDDSYRMGSGTLSSSPSGSNKDTSDAIASLYSAPQRPPLEALLGHVRRLSRDQVGCRLLQQALDEEGPMAATLILNEGISFWGESMVDPFGNYLFQKILEKITAEERISLIKSVSARLVNASLNLHGTRSVQKVVELCAIDEAQSPEAKDPSDGTAAEILTRALTPAAARLCIDSHGNHVIQRILLKLNHKHARFVFDAVAASVGDVARHRHGCCVIQRCLDSPSSDARSHLVHRIVEKCLELMQDAYGNYVVQYVLDVCGDEDVHAVCESVVGRVCLLAIQKFSSNVMEKCLERCTDRVKDQYLNELSDTERIRELMMDPFGNYVVQRALSVATHAQAVRLVEAMRPHLIASQPGAHGQRNGGMRNTAGGRRIMAKICRRFPNFSLNGMGTTEELYSPNKGHGKRHHHHSQVPYMNTHHYGGHHHHPQQHHNLSPYGAPSQHRGAAPPQYFDSPSAGYYDPMRSGHPYPHM